ncbi:MAG: TetR/AcrR family transcriptional regulator [Chloroflexota bacterium]|nr:TetR/AcrR family transcriptional regulator [Chloroflexota bacterium]MDQ6906565.1 TetR/AcrR family transcriptional regulator [Chloroflexota bacterium]
MTTTAGAKGRRARYGEEMRQDILQAARDIIAEEGAGALSIRGIARRIGYSAPALYEYFAGKEAIAEALFVAGFRQLAAMMEQVTEPDPIARLRDLGMAYRAFAIAHPQEYSLMFSRPIPEFQPSSDDLDIATTAFAPLQHTFEEGIAAGVIRPMEARTGATASWAFLHGLVSLELAGMGGPPPDPDYALPPGTVVPGHFPSLYETALNLFNDAIRTR